MEIKICFAASSGGHYEQLLMLKPLMEKYNSFIITEKTGYRLTTVKNRKTYLLRQINRKRISFPILLLINSLHSFGIFLKERPNIVICTGVISMIPICLIAKLFRKKLIFIESYAKIHSPTLSGRFLYKFADQFYIQWKELETYYPKAIYKGGIY